VLKGSVWGVAGGGEGGNLCTVLRGSVGGGGGTFAVCVGGGTVELS
jgi:hypothetical protein